MPIHVSNGTGASAKMPIVGSRGGRFSSATERFMLLTRQELPTPQNFEVRVISQNPRIYVVDDFLSREECDVLISFGQDGMDSAQVASDHKGKDDIQHGSRNNSKRDLSIEEENIEVVSHMLKRMHRYARIPEANAELTQIRRDAIGEKFELHVDSGGRDDVLRPATILTFLSDVDAGGEVLFTRGVAGRELCSQDWHGRDDGHRAHDIGNCCELEELPEGMVRVLPKRGRAILFYNHNLVGQLDSSTEHGVCPVKVGVRWVAQRWFRFDDSMGLLPHILDPRFDGLPSELLVPGVGKSLRPGRLDVRVLSQTHPRIYLIDDFLSLAECRYLIDVATHLQMSEDGAGMMRRRWVPLEAEAGDATIASVVKRMHRAARVQEGHAEALQLGSFAAGGKLEIHIDSSQDLQTLRPLTLLIYLDGDGIGGGGETVFPLGRCRDLTDCCGMRGAVRGAHASSAGPLLVSPRAGRALLFATHHLDGTLDLASAHGACPAGPGGKWIAQRWFRSGDEMR